MHNQYKSITFAMNLKRIIFHQNIMTTTSGMDAPKWYVIGGITQKEIKVRDDMRRRGFQCYVPMKYEIRTIMGKKSRRLVPAIHGLLFVNSTIADFQEYAASSPSKIFIRSIGTGQNRELMWVATHEMENFIRLTQHVEENLTYYKPEEIQLTVGDKIKVHGGVFDGIEGVLVRLPGKRAKQLVVSIPQISAVAVSLNPEVIEVIGHSTKMSTDLDGDLKQLFDMSFNKLFAPPDQQLQEHEYNLLTSELRRTLCRVEPHKGYTAARQAEMALAIYMAHHALGTEQMEQPTARLQSAIAALKDSSMLKLRLKLYYARLAPETEMMEQLLQTVKKWNQTGRLSEQQRRFKEEMRKMGCDKTAAV